MARQAGLSPRHEQLLTCPACDVSEPLPADLSATLDTLLDALVTRIGPEGIRMVFLRVPPPPAYAACARCGTSRRQCGACQVDHAKRVWREIGLTEAEETQWRVLLATARAQDRQRRPRA